MSMCTVGPLGQDEAERRIRQPVAEYYTYSDEALSNLIEYSDRLPMELQRLAHHAVQAMLEADAASISAAHAERALQRALTDWEPTYRLLWNGGLDKAGKPVERFSDDLRAKLLDFAERNSPLPAELLTGE